jgi:V/A-type H+/Na+-transporting ATPase subunit E
MLEASGGLRLRGGAMAEELQSLLERIHKDGIRKAEAEAAKVTAEATRQAEALLQEARHQAQSIVAKAEQTAQSFDERARKSIEQAARDVILAVGQSVSGLFAGIAREEVASALTGDTLRRLLTTVVEAYCTPDSARQVELRVTPAQKQEIVDYLSTRFAGQMRQGLTVTADPAVGSGFRVSLTGQNIQHDFTRDAIAESLTQYLRPELAEIVRSAART